MLKSHKTELVGWGQGYEMFPLQQKACLIGLQFLWKTGSPNSGWHPFLGQSFFLFRFLVFCRGLGWALMECSLRSRRLERRSVSFPGESLQERSPICGFIPSPVSQRLRACLLPVSPLQANSLRPFIPSCIPIGLWRGLCWMDGQPSPQTSKVKN